MNSVIALAIYALVAGAHVVAFWRTSRSEQAGSRPGRLRDAALAQLGLLIAVLAVVTLAYWSDVYIWVRAIQDIMLTFIAPPLIVLGRPWLELRQLYPAGWRTPGRNAAALSGAARTTSREDLPELPARWSRVGPVLATIAFNAAWLGWHLHATFDLVETNATVRLAEQASYLATGYWFWLQVAGPQRYGHWQAPLRRLALVAATVGCSTVLGMALVFGAHVDYPAYSNSAHHIMTVLDDQQLSGAVLWMGTLPALITAGVALLNAWLNQEESAPADPGALLRSRTTGWPARPRIR
jgi:cytochrome c oxidase assembly factor CtaG